jgi:hypothetical protein
MRAIAQAEEDFTQRRKVPISGRLARELEARWLFVDDVQSLVFPSEAGTVIDSSNLMERVLKKAGRRAGVPWVCFHTFRHTRATTLFRRGVNPKQAQLWLGHHSAAFTSDTYVHLLPDDLPDAEGLDLTDGDDGNKGATSPTETLFRPVGDEEGESALLAGETLGSLRSVGG